MTKIYDVAIIGTGSVGAAAGYYASQSGKQILELDLKTPPHDQGSHHGATRIIRHAYGEGAIYLPLLLQAQKLWNDLQRQSKADIFHQTGVLNVGPQDADFINNVALTAKEYQLPIEEYTNEEIHQKWPNFHFNSEYKGIFEKNAGYLNSEIAVKTYVNLGKQNGVVQDFNAFVTAIVSHDDGTVEIRTKQQNYYAKQVIVSAGTWAKKLLPNLPIQPVRKVFAWFKTDDTRLNEQSGFPAFTVEINHGSTFYGFPAHDNKIKIGKHDGGQPINERNERTPFGSYPTDEHEIDPLLGSYLTGTDGIDHGAACTYDLSPDGNFIIDYLPGHDNIQIVTGLSGHGFKFASVLGQLLSQRAIDKSIDFDLSPFKITRFN